MDKASLSGSEDCRFESCLGRIKQYFRCVFTENRNHCYDKDLAEITRPTGDLSAVYIVMNKAMCPNG